MIESSRDASERDVEAALMRGQRRAWVGDPEFSGRLENVRESIASVAARGEHARAADLLQALVSGCLEKLPEVDDSLGRYARFVERLLADWIRVRQLSGADPAETAVGLAAWIVADEGGLLERYRMWGAGALDEDGRGALQMVLQMWSEDLEPGSAALVRSAEIEKAIHVQSGDVETYATLCEEVTGLSPRDAEVLAETCRRQERLEEALVWADRGLALPTGRAPAAWELPRLRRTILSALGRGEEARDEAWSAFTAHPSVTRFEELTDHLGSPESAFDALRDAPLSVAIEVLLVVGDDVRLARLVSDATLGALREVSQILARPAAERLRAANPLLAARLYAAVALRLLGSGRKTYYRRILSDLREARDLLRGPGGDLVWARLVELIRMRCAGKTVFLPRFESVVRGR